MRSHPLAQLRLSEEEEDAPDDSDDASSSAAGWPVGIGGAPPLPPPPTWRASHRTWQVPLPNAETWRLLSSLPQRLRHGILSMAVRMEVKSDLSFTQSSASQEGQEAPPCWDARRAAGPSAVRSFLPQRSLLRTLSSLSSLLQTAPEHLIFALSAPAPRHGSAIIFFCRPQGAL